ncbi:MAG: ABC transporter ATP-binding protein [Alphaproteobacteria bacterium]|jgi:branched-chain amino acid transport system ATP-binding protein|nr:ABC transporter ATP-binding protein [Alphaproteobacteria bacterium]
MNVLDVHDLYKGFGGVQAVAGVSFGVAEGELLALIGPNGAGKSTCFNMLNGQLKPDRGSVRLKGADITGLPPRTVSRLGVGRTFQITATFGSMTVAENVQTALISHRGGMKGLWRPAAALYRDEALALLGRVGMADQADRACGVLAYGDLKRVELAVALANDPGLLLMDEPTAGMAPGERVELMALTAGITRERGIAVLFTEHDMDVVFAHADRIIVLNRGELIAEGPPDAVRADQRVRELYLGESLEAE